MIAAVVLGATRPTGAIVSAALAADWCRRVFAARRENVPIIDTDRVLSATVVLGPLMGTAIFSAYVYGLTGSPFTWATAQAGWGRPTQNPLWALATAIAPIAAHPGQAFFNNPPEVLNTLAAVLCLALALPIGVRLGVAYGALTFLGALVPLAAGGVASMGRYTAVIFPLYLWGAAVIPQRAWPYMLVAGLAAQGLVAALFFSWRSMY